jgi:choice-of-anchor B domain-containing protein
MMYRFLTLVFMLAAAPLQAQLHLQQLAHVPNDSGITLAGCWHHVDSIGNEYALVGHRLGLDIYDVTIPTTPVRRFRVPGLVNNWREVKTWGGFAYVGSEAAGSGITIVDMRQLPDTVLYKVWFGNDSLENMIQRSHTVGAEDGYLYVYGSTAPNNGAIICDLSDPWNPDFVGQYQTNYLHDGLVVGDTLFGSEIYQGQFSVIDISDKTNPVILATQPTPGAFNHNTTLSKNNKILFTADERPFTPVGAFDISDLSNITLLDIYYPSQRPTGEVHNVRRVGDDYLVCPSYQGQLTIVDVSEPTNMIETAWSILGTSLVWDADPYLPSGIIFATAKNEGLFIYQPTYVRAARLKGVVTDAVTGLPLFNAKVFVESTSNADTTNIQGLYATGAPQTGNYNIRAERQGYVTKTVNRLLQNGTTVALDIALQPEDVSTASIGDNDVISVFPTVVKNGFWVKTPSRLPATTLLQIYDNTGKLILEQKAQSKWVDMPNDTAPGVYHVRVGGFTQQIVKTN